MALRELVNELLRSPEFQSGLQQAITNCVQSVPVQTRALSEVIPPSSNTASGSTIPSNSSQQRNASVHTCLNSEIRRLFPSIPSVRRQESAMPQSQSQRLFARNQVRPKNKKYKVAYTTYSRDVILVEGPSVSKVLRGTEKVTAFQNGFGVCAAKFEKNWGKIDIENMIRELFKDKLPDGAGFDILIPISGQLVDITLAPGDELDGLSLSKVSAQKAIYVRPKQDLQIDTLENCSMESTTDERTAIQSPVDELCSTELRRPNDTEASVSEDDLPSFLNSTNNMLDSFSEQDNDVELAIQRSLNEGGNNELTLNNILTQIQASLDMTNSCAFNINRDTVFECCIRSMRRKTFSPCKKISVMFTDILEKSEGAIDNGGPTRELFRLALKEISQGKLFEGSAHSKNLSLDTKSIEDKLYYEAGRLISMALVHAGLGPCFFSHVLFTSLTDDISHCKPCIEDVTNAEVRELIEKVDRATDMESLQQAIEDGSTYFSISGCQPYVQDVAQKESIVNSAISFYVTQRNRAARDQFSEGLETLGILNYMRQRPDEFHEVMCNSEQKLTAEVIKTLFVANSSSPVGSNKLTKERRVLGYWWDYLADCEEETTDAKLCDILTFATGSDRIPALGFHPTPSLDFLHDEDSKYPKANTCSMCLKLPVVHTSYDIFKYSMDFGILNGMVFGFV